ncbi:hypothetical protein C8K30_103289 [Promicromonospora sp. AC04]|uniref:hypothetical protein n=1 Tax=Promicromonospora sp. AC04 TaxID=2135723 RepID=UPI000D362A03|nr:hypothetical protein [Promicromonospora sp. AC04]PUB28864.1 hypothetical protein C8K30_103289 [Promicromonospora sp. AC04]
MSLPSTSTFRRGLVAVATATTLLAAGLVVAPAAQAALPVVDSHTSQGTTVTTSMFASGSTIFADVDGQRLYPARFGYTVALKASGGTMLGAEVEVTLQKIDRERVRKRTIEMKRTSTGMLSRGTINFPGTIDPGTYRVGVEVFTVVRKADGTRVRHLIDVNEAQRVQFRLVTEVYGTVSSQATDGRPARINATARVLRIDDDGSLSLLRIRSGAAILSFDADGPYGASRPVFVRDLKIGSDGKISTVVESRKGYWKVTYPGTSRFADSRAWIGQGMPDGCGC